MGSDPTEWARADSTLVDAASTGIDHSPTVLDDVDGNGGLWVLRGPRRVGKSVALKRTALRFCSRNDPMRLIYLAVDGFLAKDLRRAFTLGRQITAVVGDVPRLWLIDEITSVDGWELLVKELRDNTALSNDGVVLTGSSAAGLQDAVRALGAGRTKVAQPFRTLLPMTFAEVLAATDAGVPKLEPVTPDRLQSSEVAVAVERMGVFADDFDLLWQRFMETGGFPRAVGDHYRHGDVGEVFARDLSAWLTTDVTPGDSAESSSELIRVLHERTASPLDVKNIADQLHSTRDRLRVRLERLVATFGAMWCHQVSDEGVRLAGAQSKLYLADPLIARLPSLLDASAPPPDFTASTEAALAVALARSIDLLHPSRLIEQRAVGYLRTGSGNEVDFAAMPIAVGGQPTVTCPIEAKWVSDGWRSEARTIVGKYGHGVVATKNIIDLSGPVWAIPAPLLALLLAT